jgi:hypothetical protein
MRKPLLALAVFAAGLTFATLPAWGRTPVLIGRVGFHNRFTISLRFPNGRLVQTLPAGTYKIVVHDYSKIHNFALGSVTQNRRIFTGSIPKVGKKTYTVHLTPGLYVYACSMHPRRMHHSFTVTPASTTSTTSTTTTTG